jgi:hypothetical protein
MMFDFQPRLDGELISMRPMAEADFEPLYTVASDPLIWAVHPTHERWQRSVFRANIDEAYAEKGGLVAINKATSAIIGFSRYSQIVVGPNEIEIGLSFLARALFPPPLWGRLGGGRAASAAQKTLVLMASEPFFSGRRRWPPTLILPHRGGGGVPPQTFFNRRTSALVSCRPPPMACTSA